MRLYTLSKRHFVLVFVVFFVCFGLTVFVGIRGKVRFLVHCITSSHPGKWLLARPTYTHPCPLLRAPGWRVMHHFILNLLGRG